VQGQTDASDPLREACADGDAVRSQRIDQGAIAARIVGGRDDQSAPGFRTFRSQNAQAAGFQFGDPTPAGSRTWAAIVSIPTSTRSSAIAARPMAPT
jgi:hypothetical protein